MLMFLFCAVLQADGMNRKVNRKKKVKRSSTELKHPISDSLTSDVLLVSFISFGPGIDFRSIPVFENSLKQFNINQKCAVQYEIKTWGREGERDYCISSKDAKCLEAFTSQTRSSFKGNERILIKEHAQCRQ